MAHPPRRSVVSTLVTNELSPEGRHISLVPSDSFFTLFGWSLPFIYEHGGLSVWLPGLKEPPQANLTNWRHYSGLNLDH